jgi:hypothetical protein
MATPSCLFSPSRLLIRRASCPLSTRRMRDEVTRRRAGIPRKEAQKWAAFFLGLFHGLGFSGGLLETKREMQTRTILLAFSIGIELWHQIPVIPLFGLMKAARQSQAASVKGNATSNGVLGDRSRSDCIAGVYYLCLTLVGFHMRNAMENGGKRVFVRFN